MLNELREQVYKANMMLPKYNLVKFTWGNVSAIDRKSGLVVIKPSGVPYEELSPEKMVIVDLSGNIIEGELNPSSDLKTHLELYKAFPEIGGVAHTHSEYAVSFAQAKEPITAYGTTHADVFYGDIPCTRDLTDEEIKEAYELNTGRVIAETFRDKDYKAIPGALVASHGPFTWGKNAEEAVYNMTVLEECAKMNLLTKIANPEVKRIGNAILDKHYYRKHGENAYYGQKAGCFDDILHGIQNCRCGKNHSVLIKKIIFEENAINKLKTVVARYSKNNKAVMICDDNTYEAAGKYAAGIVDFFQIIKLNPQNLHANEKAVETVMNTLKEDVDLMVAVGSGTIHDITRYVAFHKNLNFISVPTAPSVDGFVSNVAAMTLNGVKKTVPAVVPIEMVADVNIISAAPKRLIASGVGDLIGKYISIFDWRVSHILTGENICEYIISLEEDAVKEVINNIEAISKADKEGIKKLFYGLVLSGLAIQMYGNSRPASGSEHHISHFIEMNVINPMNDAYHGEKVGIGFGMVCDKYKEFAKIDSLDGRLIDNYKFPKAMIADKFGSLTEEIFKENESDCLERVKPQVFIENFDKIKALINELPDGEDVRSILKKVGAPSTLEDIGLSELLKDEIYKYSPYVRNRLTLMRCFNLLM